MLEVNEYYSSIARNLAQGENDSCCQDDGTKDANIRSLGSTDDLLQFALPKEGETIIDLGSGPGHDVLRAADKIGQGGKAIGIDFSDDMLELAQANATAKGMKNVEFVKSNLTELQINSGIANLVMSNCVINLVPNKNKVLQESYRVLKPGGRFVISDIIAISNYPSSFKNDTQAFCSCVSGAITEDEYRSLLQTIGFHQIEIIREQTNRQNYNGTNIEYGASIIKAIKPKLDDGKDCGCSPDCCN